MIRVFGLDLSLSNSGIAGFTSESERPWLSFVASEPVGESIELLADRIHAATSEVYTKITRLVQPGDDVLIVFEGPAPAAAAASGRGKPDERAGMRWILTVAFRRAGYRLVYVKPNTAKKYWTDNGNASKALMLGWARRRYAALGVGIRDHNQADALALAHMGASHSGIVPTPLPPLVNSTLLDGIDWPTQHNAGGTTHG
ncbi:MAG: hypothetical protein AB7T06_40785 [Kofleriaceae bacterium]